MMPQPSGPYDTTYKREYHAPPGPPGHGDRPRSTSRAYQAAYELQGQVGSTTYQNEYYGKKGRRAVPLRTGSASGNRRNNPHPFESFMVWRFPQELRSEGPYSEWANELTDDVMDKVLRGQLASTYQSDYLGIPQGYQMQEAVGAHDDWKSRIPYTLDSSTRHTYQQPNQQPALKGNTMRYGCNKKKHIPANGVVPTVSDRQKHLKTRTTYEREYKYPGGGGVVTGGPARVDYARQGGAQALSRQYETATGQEKQDISDMLQSMYIHPPSPPGSSTSRGRSSRLAATPTYPPTGCLNETNPNWMSTYNGPVPQYEIDS